MSNRLNRFSRIARAAALVGAASSTIACTSGSSPEDPQASSQAALAATMTASNIASIREIEDHRLLGNAQLAGFLSNADPSVRAAAATAVGRIGDPSLQSNVAALLGDGSATVRRAAALSLGLLGTTTESALDARFAIESDTETKQAILQALAQAGTATSIPLVTAALASQPDEVQAAAAEAYGTLVGGGVAPSTDAGVETQLIALAGSAPEARSIAAAYALAALPVTRSNTDEGALTKAFHAATAPSARAFLTTPLSKLGTTSSVATLVAASSGDADERVRGAACGALATTGTGASVTGALTAALADSSHAVVVASATAIGTLGSAAASLAPQLEAAFDASSSAWVRSTLLSALVAVAPASSRARVLAGLTDSWPVQLAAIAALPSIATAADVTTLLALVAGSDKRLSFASIEAISAFPAALITPAVKTAMIAVLARNDWELTSGVADVAVAFSWTDFAAKLDAAYPSFTGDAAMNGRLEIVYALGSIGSTADVPLLQSAIQDDTVLVSQYAAASYQQITGTDVSDQVRKENVVTTQTPSNGDVDDALSSLVVLDTTRGEIAIQMLTETPLNAVNFVRLARSGFYDGLGFHRVIPNFVAQGGDPRGDGTGGSDQMVRDELSRVPHLRGTVGLATEGKDTGSSQFFFNEGWNVGLDERYTVFGNVVYGLAAAEQLEVGDTIKSATVLPGFGALDALNETDSPSANE